MKEAKDEVTKGDMERGFQTVPDMNKTSQPNQNARLTGKMMPTDDDESNEMDD